MTEASTNNPATSAPFTTRLVWQGSERFAGDVDGAPVTLDGSSEHDLSPMQAVLAGLAGCMGIDIAMILEKGRQPLDGLTVELQGHRAEKPPRRFVRYQLVVKVSGDTDRNKVDRAVELSRQKYCSVWHSLAQDAPLEVVVETS